MRILVTGGAGFIGSHVAEACLAAGHTVLIVDNLSHGNRGNVPPGAQLAVVDLLDFSALEKVFADFQPEILNHHAAHTSVAKSWDVPEEDARINILGSLHLLQLGARHRVQKTIYASSGGAVYGDPSQLPATEETPVRPISNYGVSKYAVELYLHSFSVSSGMKFVALRYPNVFGPRQDPNGEAGVVAIFTRQLLTGETPRIFGDGGKTRDYVYVEDIVRANVLALATQENTVTNLGWGNRVTDMEVFQAVRDAVGSKAEPVFEAKRPGEIEHICLDASLAKKVLQWEPQVPFSEGVQQVVRYWKERLITKPG